jgi:hypothetical protein
MPHTPALHDGVPFCELQTMPHPPQFAMSVLMFVSQPAAAVQSP